jgi:hypothetical protein
VSGSSRVPWGAMSSLADVIATLGDFGPVAMREIEHELALAHRAKALYEPEPHQLGNGVSVAEGKIVRGAEPPVLLVWKADRRRRPAGRPANV